MTFDPAISAALAVGDRHERSLDVAARKAGAHFTPAEVASAMVDDALNRWGTGDPVICDPSCGGAVFLVLAADALWSRGGDPLRILTDQLIGFDTSIDSVDASRAALVEWARLRGTDSGVEVAASGAVIRRDALDGVPWTSSSGRGADIVLGNPPFQSQLSARTSRTSSDRQRLVTVFGDAAKGYVDIAALFTVAALRAVPDGGVVSMVLPRSIVAARDAAGARLECRSRGALVAVWFPLVKVFAAAVDVFVPVFEVASPHRNVPVTVLAGADRTECGTVGGDDLDISETWSPLWASAHGVPELALTPAPDRRVADVATTSAGFRDHYYGVVPHVAETPEGRRAKRLMTTAMIDPGSHRWGERSVRIARKKWLAPWVDLDGVAADTPSLAGWCSTIGTPRVLVATQTRIIEAVADPEGDFVPLTPIISVVEREDASYATPGGRDGHAGVTAIAAALSAPPATVWALRMFGGGGLSSAALKLSASQVGRVPLPVDAAAWEEAVALFGPPMERSAFATAATRSWSLDRPDITEWWLDR